MTKAFKTGINAPSVAVNGTAVSVDGHTHAGGGGAPTDATYVVTSANATLTNERVLTQGTYLTITDNGSSTVTIAVDATSANTASKVVARDSSGNFSAGTITASLTGTASGNVPNGRTVTATAPLTIAGTTSADLSADRTIAVSAASTSAAGVVQLSDSTSTTGSTKAATETAVKAAYDIGAAAVPKSTVTTAGDLIVGTGNATVSRLGIGTNGYVLTSNGTTATWAAAGAASIPDTGWKADVRVATTAALTGTGTLTYNAGAGTFTWATAGPTTIDGVTLANGDRILVKDEGANALRNGIYVRTSTTVLTRATDADSAAEIAASAVNVLSGTANGGTLWTTNFKSTDTLGTTAMNWYAIVDTNTLASSPTVVTPTLTLSTTTSTAEGRIAWDATNDQIEVGTGTTLAVFGQLGSTNGVALGTAAAGTAGTSARSDHVHPTTGLVALDANGNILASNFQPTVSTLGTTGTINIDFAGDGFRTQAALTGNITYTASNYAAGRSVTIRVTNGTTIRTLGFPAGWKFLAGSKPASIAASKVGVLTVTSFGTVEADVVAAWSVEA